MGTVTAVVTVTADGAVVSVTAFVTLGVVVTVTAFFTFGAVATVAIGHALLGNAAVICGMVTPAPLIAGVVAGGMVVCGIGSCDFCVHTIAAV